MNFIWSMQALNYAYWKGIDTEAMWPYTASDEACNAALIASPTSGNLLQSNGYSSQVSPSNSESALKAVSGAWTGE